MSTPRELAIQAAVMEAALAVANIGRLAELDWKLKVRLKGLLFTDADRDAFTAKFRLQLSEILVGDSLEQTAAERNQPGRN